MIDDARAAPTLEAATAQVLSRSRVGLLLGARGRGRYGYGADCWSRAKRLAPIAQLAEAADLKSAQSGFESQWGHHVCTDHGTIFRLDRLAEEGWGRKETSADRAPPFRASALTAEAVPLSIGGTIRG